jgi:hypothetical protein
MRSDSGWESDFATIRTSYGWMATTSTGTGPVAPDSTSGIRRSLAVTRGMRAAGATQLRSGDWTPETVSTDQIVASHGDSDQTGEDQWAPRHENTAGIVFSSTTMSCQSVQLFTYQTSSCTRLAYEMLLRPLTCQSPVSPGRIA